MDAEEFMRYGIDSDLSGEEEDCPVKPLEKGEVAVAGETSSQRQKRYAHLGGLTFQFEARTIQGTCTS